ALFPTAAAAVAVAITGAPRRAPDAGQASLAAQPGAARAAIVLLVWAAAWAGTEWLRGTILTGFSWLNVGYAHVDGPLAGWAPLFGVYGVAFFAVLCAGALAGFVVWRGQARVVALLFLAAALVFGAALRAANWGIQPAGEAVAVRLVQGNVEQSN